MSKPRFAIPVWLPPCLDWRHHADTEPGAVLEKCRRCGFCLRAGQPPISCLIIRDTKERKP